MMKTPRVHVRQGLSGCQRPGRRGVTLRQQSEVEPEPGAYALTSFAARDASVGRTPRCFGSGDGRQLSPPVRRISSARREDNAVSAGGQRRRGAIVGVAALECRDVAEAVVVDPDDHLAVDHQRRVEREHVAREALAGRRASVPSLSAARSNLWCSAHIPVLSWSAAPALTEVLLAAAS